MCAEYGAARSRIQLKGRLQAVLMPTQGRTASFAEVSVRPQPVVREWIGNFR
jgi:hypothetical protein